MLSEKKTTLFQREKNCIVVLHNRFDDETGFYFVSPLSFIALQQRTYHFYKTSLNAYVPTYKLRRNLKEKLHNS